MPATILGGRYEIRSLIGRGGMARVYLGRDTRLLRDVAIKIVDIQRVGEKASMLFHREARAAAALKHFNIVQVFDYSGPEESPAYLVMELIDGLSIDELMGIDIGLPEVVAVVVARAVASALEHSHERGVIHRDLKPANVMFEWTGRVLLTDFGVAKAHREPGLLGKTVACQETGLVGTPTFMAPEQVIDEAVGPMTDVFAFGSLLYCLLHGQSPFADKATLQVLRRIVNVEFEPLREVRPQVSPRLDALVSSCLQSSPEARPSTRDVAQQCGEWLMDAGVVSSEQALADYLESQRTALSATVVSQRVDELADIPIGEVSEGGTLITEVKSDPTTATEVTEQSVDSDWYGTDVEAPTQTAVPAVARQPKHDSAEPSGPVLRSAFPIGWAVAGGLGVGVVAVAVLVSLMSGPPDPVPTPIEEVQLTEGAAGNPSVQPSPPPEAADPDPIEPSVPQADLDPAIDEPRPASAPEPRGASKVKSGHRAKRKRKRPSVSTPPVKPDTRPAEPGEPARIVVNVRPWGKVWVDGVEKGTTPVVRTLVVPSGAHTITVRHPTLGESTRRVTVGGGERVSVSFDLR